MPKWTWRRSSPKSTATRRAGPALPAANHSARTSPLSPDPHLFGLIDHWTVSPKCHPIAAGFEHITELKYVVGKSFREDRVQTELADLVYLQPESSEPRYVQKTLEILTRHPEWRLSCRIHKVLGLP